MATAPHPPGDSVLTVCLREVRKPGRNYTNLFAALGTVSDAAARASLVVALQKEASKFRKETLIAELEEYLRVVS